MTHLEQTVKEILDGHIEPMEIEHIIRKKLMNAIEQEKLEEYLENGGTIEDLPRQTQQTL